MAVDLTKFLALQIEGEGIGVVLSGKIGTDLAFVLEDKTSSTPDPSLSSFSLETYPSGPGAHPVSLWVRMTYEQLEQLDTALKGQARQLPPGMDPAQFQAFMGAVEADLAREPSTRFTGARFGAIARALDGALVGHLGLGVDVAGTVHDRAGTITAEQHVVPRPPGAFRRLSRADRLSLANAINAYMAAQPGTDPVWKTVAQDAGK